MAKKVNIKILSRLKSLIGKEGPRKSSLSRIVGLVIAAVFIFVCIFSLLRGWSSVERDLGCEELQNKTETLKKENKLAEAYDDMSSSTNCLPTDEQSTVELNYIDKDDSSASIESIYLSCRLAVAAHLSGKTEESKKHASNTINAASKLNDEELNKMQNYSKNMYFMRGIISDSPNIPESQEGLC